METKNIVATIYLKDGNAVKSMEDFTIVGDVFQICRLYNDSGIDKIMIFDLSTSDEEHEKNIHTIKLLNRNLEVKVCAGGNINRIDDIKKLLYAGCAQVILNGSKALSMSLAEEASGRFGKDRMLVSVNNVDFIFKQQKAIREMFHEMYILNPMVLDALENLTTVPYVVHMQEYNFDRMIALLNRDHIRGIAGPFIDDPDNDIMALKSLLSQNGIKMDNFAPELLWEDLVKNSEGLVPVIVQDYLTDEVLFMSYMNEVAFNTTIHNGKMTYYNKEERQMYYTGLNDIDIQYVKSLTADNKKKTILAKVSCVTGANSDYLHSTYNNTIVKKAFIKKNPLNVLEEVYAIILDRKNNPKDSSYTNYLFDKGLEKILKCLGEDYTELVMAAMKENNEELKYEIADFLYHSMVLMVEKGVTWQDITAEFAQR